jgi:hypothetical protein
MGKVSIEIANAIKTLDFSVEQIVKLDYNNGKKLYKELLDYYVKSGDRRWWWEDFKYSSFYFIDFDRPFEYLNEIIPESSKKVWFMVEDDKEDYYPIYNCDPLIIGQIISECFAFEYYVIDKELNWLICENHHNRLIGIGDLLMNKNKDRIK